MATKTKVAKKPAVKRFAKVFDVPPYQVLVYARGQADDDEQYKLEITTEIDDGVLATITKGFKEMKHMEESFDYFDQKGAESFIEAILQMTA